VRTGFVIGIFILLFASCKKDTYNIDKIRKCNDAQNLDSVLYSKLMIGSWKFESTYSYWENTFKKANTDFSVKFSSDGTFIMYENNSIINQGKWNVVGSVGSFYLSYSPLYAYISGRILLCGDKLVFDQTNADLGADIFLRVN
jgi:hypothetical protein